MIFIEIRCARCGKKLSERKYMVQIIEYLGSWNPRDDICEDCYQAFINFMKGDK